MAGISKLKIQPLDGKKSYEVLINPASLKAAYTVKYSEKQGLGTASPELKFQYIPAGQISFQLIFDGTGLVGKKKQSVPDQVTAFRNATFKYQGDEHKPNLVKLIWGTSVFQGYLTSLSINYKLFKSDGTPIRAEADVSFNTSENAKASAKKRRSKSSDLTHIRKIKAGDRLPNICNSIYNGANYYIQVAKHNQLNHLRKLKPGVELSFPPLVD